MTHAELVGLTEEQFQRQVTDLARIRNWVWVHVRAGRTLSGDWRVPTSGPLAKGWPDLVLVRERIVFAELKTDRGRITADQHAVHDLLRAAGAEAYIWRPKDWDEIDFVLQIRG
jgi:hypothetical protein